MAEYQYRHGLSSPTVTAEQTYTELERIRAKHDEKLNPRDIVDESRAATAVLHPFFQWDDEQAAEEYRVWQARRLSRSVYVLTAATATEPARESPVYFHVEPHNYQPSSVLRERTDLWELALQALHSRLSAADRAVRELEQLAKDGKNPDRMTAIALAVQGFEAVRAAVSIIK